MGTRRRLPSHLRRSINCMLCLRCTTNRSPKREKEKRQELKDMMEIARRKARLSGLAIYGKIEPLHEVCPCLLVGNTFPEKRFIITGRVQLAPALKSRRVE